MRRVVLLSLSVVLGLGTGCAGHRPESVRAAAVERTLREVPTWYSAEEGDSTRLVGKATAVSSDLQAAVDIAKAEARATLLLQVETRTTAMTKRFREQSGAADPVLLSQFTAVSRDVAAGTLRGLRTRRQEVQRDGELFRAYVALELPAGEAARELLDRLRQDERLRTDERAREAFEELGREVERYEASRRGEAHR